MSGRMKILIAYDGSDCAEAALDDLRLAGLPGDAEALVVSVTEVWLPPPPPSVYEVIEEAEAARTPAELQRGFVQHTPAVEQAQSFASRARERLLNNFPGWEVSAEAFYGSPAREVIRRADEWGPDLVVVGSHGRSALGRLVLGSVSQKVVTEAHSSVRVARGRVEVEPRAARVLIGVDGSPGAEAALRAVASRCWPPGSEARVCVVDDLIVPGVAERLIPPLRELTEEENRGETAWVRETAEGAARLLSAAGLAASSTVLTGEPPARARRGGGEVGR